MLDCSQLAPDVIAALDDLRSQAAEPRPVLDLAPWHEARPHLVLNAISEAQRAAPDLTELAEHMLPRMPRRPLASQTIRAITRDRYSAPFLLDTAATLPWIALDSEEVVNAIAIDIDHADGDDRVDDLSAYYGLRRPALVQDPWSGRSHAIAMLKAPVPVTDAARVGPRILLDLAGRLLAAALGGTLMPHRSLVKSPWGLTENLIGARLRRSPTPAVPGLWEAYVESGSPLMWRTLPGDCHAYELREIIAALADDFGEVVASPAARQHFRRRRPEPSALGRNCALFDLVRYWAYDRHERDGGAILDEAIRVNALFSDPLPANEVAATARSIARFMNSRFHPATGANTRRGRDAVEGAGLDLAAKRELAARRTAEGHAAKTDAAIAAGVARLIAEGSPVTQAALAAASGVSIRTLKRRWRKVPNAALSGSAGDTPAQGPQAPPSKANLNPLPSLAELAARDRRIRRTVADLDAVAVACGRSGAAPQPLPVVPADIAAVPAVAKARHAAREAADSARRRQEARGERQAAAERRQQFEDWAAQPDGWTRFREHLADLDAVFDALTAEAPADRFASARLAAKREAVFAGRWKSWRAALTAVRGRQAAALQIAQQEAQRQTPGRPQAVNKFAVTN